MHVLSHASLVSSSTEKQNKEIWNVGIASLHYHAIKNKIHDRSADALFGQSNPQSYKLCARHKPRLWSKNKDKEPKIPNHGQKSHAFSTQALPEHSPVYKHVGTAQFTSKFCGRFRRKTFITNKEGEINSPGTNPGAGFCFCLCIKCRSRAHQNNNMYLCTSLS